MRTTKTLTGTTLVRAALVSALLAIASLAMTASSAFGAYSHSTSEPPFTVTGCNQIYDIVVLEAQEMVYVSCSTPSFKNVIKRFDLVGNPKSFSASAPYISGNTLTADPGGTSEEFNNVTKLAVDNSASPNHGLLFVTSTPNVDVFRLNGEFAGALVQPLENSIPNDILGVDVGPDGSIYVTSGLPGSRVSKYGPGFNEVKRLYPSPGFESPYGGPSYVRVDTTGAVWQSHGGTFGESSDPDLNKFEADQFTEELEIGLILPYPSQEKLIRPWVADRSPFAPDPLLTTENFKFDVDLTDNDLYVNRGDRIETYSQGNAEELSFKDAPTFGTGVLTESRAIAVTTDHHVYASTEGNKVVRFGPGSILPDIRTFIPNIAEIGHVDATVHGKVEPAGGANVNKCKVEYGLDTTYSGPDSGSVKCTPDAEGVNYTGNTNVEAKLTGLKTGKVYHYRVTAGNVNGENSGIDRTVIPAFVLQVQTLQIPAEKIDTEGAFLRGTLDPDGIPTTYHFDYGVTSSYGLSTPEVNGGATTGIKTVEEQIQDLPSGKVIHYRIVAKNSTGTTYGPDRTFRVASTPDITNIESLEREPTSALIRAGINPVGFDSEYHVEYGTTSEFGQRLPATDVNIGSGNEPVVVSQKLEGLQEGVTYHFRIVATNKWGTSFSGDTTFDYSPPGCPNDHIRQQTRSSYLPDCRAYELVSPRAAGAVNLFPSDEAKDKCNLSLCVWAVNRGYANSPPRFAYFGGLGAINGLEPPTGEVDMYMATRTSTGWVSSVPGLAGDEAFFTEGKQCSERMDYCIDKRFGEEGGFKRTLAPFLFTAAGDPLGQLPTNLASIPKGHESRGANRMSDDFSHFVFSSGEVELFGPPSPAVAFAPGGVTSGMGSVYDNDIGARTVKIASKLPNGENLPEDKPVKEAIEIPGLSRDGSHILMQTRAGEGFYHLYMRVDDAITYDITGGFGAEFVGMMRDGSKVFLASSAHLTADDTDSGKDLFMWDENSTLPNKLIRISQGNGQGNSDACTATGLNTCSIKTLLPERLHPSKNSLVSIPGQDDVMAEGSGDTYFFSPELLDPEKAGVKNESNLYLYRHSKVQLVTTFDPGTNIKRIQVSLDGAHSAFITSSQLTSYDNNGFEEMYTYDADTGVLLCVSCNPSGDPAAFDVKGSQGGRFMADDGRAFFSTEESLVPQDANGDIMDTYEYVGGRPQLITSGQASRDFTGGSEILSLVAIPELVGLEHVSRDGTDVYFSTFETLVTQDDNGQFVKFYDARTNGGFPDNPDLGPCAAADECHGTDSSPPAAPVVGTSAGLGNGGNVQPEQQKKKKKKKKKKTKNKRHANRHAGGNRG
jgi:hypothetical protein